MELSEKLELKPIRSEPDVWISRFAIFERLTPRPVKIRDISLKPGLNIVCAEESVDQNSISGITGHSAGKTTFCRLIRYLLGEKTFGTRAATESIRKAFPDGYVAAELCVYGKKWAVRRPLGSGRMTFIKENFTIEELLTERGRSVAQEAYPAEVGLEKVLDRLLTGDVVQTGEPIQWGHIVAWCTRDQETRFQNIYDWRSSRSESDAPSFRFPKAGPLFLMRSVMGLFLPDELKGEERIATLQRDKEKHTKRIEERKREPEFRVNLYDTRLRQILTRILSEERDIASRPFRSEDLTEDLERLSEKARSMFKDNLEHIDQKRGTVQEEIDDLGAKLREHRKKIEQLRVHLAMNEGVEKEAKEGDSGNGSDFKLLDELQDKMCPAAGIPFSDCSYYLQYRNKTVLMLSDAQDDRAMKEYVSKRKEVSKIAEEEISRLTGVIEKIQVDRDAVLKERATLAAMIQDKHDALRDLEDALIGLTTWTRRRDLSEGDEELNALQKSLSKIEREIGEIETELATSLRLHDKNRETLTSIFSGVVKSVLPSGQYDGKVSLDSRELGFEITQGPSMTGEAVETLSVLLADISCLAYYCVNEAVRLPGFMLHDSPREADLSLRLYHNLIRMVAELENRLASKESCPFQYVITTTTAPPPELNNDQYVRLRLNAGKEEDLLFRRNIADVKAKDVRQGLLVQ